MKINFVVPSLDKEKFSGGVLCLLHYANGLAKIGHEVNVVPFTPSDRPEWFVEPWCFNFVHTEKNQLFKEAFYKTILFPFKLINNILSGKKLKDISNKNLIRSTTGAIFLSLSQYSSFGASKGGAIDNLIKILPDADITIATDSETAYAVALINRGRGFYFSQHYEPFFWKERIGGVVSKREAELSYMLGLKQIVNSPWLGRYLTSNGYCNSYQLCPNAIDHNIFNGSPKAKKLENTISIISYGGREADWKGFHEMCEGMRIAKFRNPEIQFKWKVYGKALLPPDNKICGYEPLGFLSSKQLAEAYRQNDVLLSASWYESFPLFPLEAMACGLAAITTQPGTEIYAEDQETALIVEPRNPESIALAIERLAKNENFRFKLATNGNLKSKEFTWRKSVDNLSKILSEAY
jgi:glycosyltransferase involved in cell wall biosynthesis